MTTFRGCCACCNCARERHAINKLVLRARKNQCNAVDCATCVETCTPCPFLGTAPGRAICKAGRCSMVIDSKKTRPTGAFEGYE